jgi:F-type H+-transporting ATPase subunit gamma
MPENLKVLRGRIRSIGKTKKITRAMEMVSAAKLRKSETIMKSSRPFMRKIQELLGRLALSTGAESHPLFQIKDSGIPLLVVFSSDRGLCGAFNANILKMTIKEIKKDPDLMIYVLGRKGRDYLNRYYPERIYKELLDVGDALDGEMTDQLSQELQDGFHNGDFSRINILYPRFVSTATNVPTVERYLPLEATAFGIEEQEAQQPIDYILEPTPERVFDAILPRFLKSKIFLTLIESITSEQSARMLAMNNATKNCDELGDALTLRLNKARQTAITTEIIEIVGGAEALNG